MFTFCLLTFHTTFLLTSHYLTGRTLYDCPIKYQNHDGAAGANVIIIIIKSNSNLNEFSLLKGSIKCIIDSASLTDLVKLLYQIFSMFVEYKPFEHCRQLAKYFFSHFPSSLIWSPNCRFLCGVWLLPPALSVWPARPAVVEYSFLPFGAGGEFWSAAKLSLPFWSLPFLIKRFVNQLPPNTHKHTHTDMHVHTHANRSLYFVHL